MAASAPGKLILFGEHAVVFGEPALATAINLRAEVYARPHPEWRADGGSIEGMAGPELRRDAEVWMILIPESGKRPPEVAGIDLGRRLPAAALHRHRPSHESRACLRAPLFRHS